MRGEWLTAGLICAACCGPGSAVPDDSAPLPVVCSPSTTDLSADADGDGAADVDERLRGLDPCARDSDGDRYTDGIELRWGSDPSDPTSVPQVDVVELRDGEERSEVIGFSLRVQRADLSFLLDTTASMGPLTEAMATEFDAIVMELEDTLPDLSYGLATFDDYAQMPFGNPDRGDLPFRLKQQQTTQSAAVRSALSSELELHYGGDPPESALEALVQALEGKGWDHHCDGALDPAVDVPPFLTTPSDAFAGAVPGTGDTSPEAAGSLGGMGFRRGALPIVVYATDAELRDPDSSYEAPPGCPSPSGAEDVVAAATHRGARLIGISVSSYRGVGYGQMVGLADRTRSVGDLSGDGVHQPLVLSWFGTGEELRRDIVHAVSELVGALSFAEVTLEVSGQGAAFVAGFSPSSYRDVRAGDFATTPLPFTLELRGISPPTRVDQWLEVDLKLVAPGELTLATRKLVIVVPGQGG